MKIVANYIDSVNVIYLDNVVSATCRCPSITVSCRYCALLQQPHELPHRISDHDFCVTFDQDVQLRVFTRLRLLARWVEASFGGNGCPSRFEYLCNIRAVGDCPSSFFWESVSTGLSDKNRKQLTREVVDLQSCMESTSVRSFVINRNPLT